MKSKLNTNINVFMRTIDLYAVAMTKGQSEQAMAYRHSIETMLINMQDKIILAEHLHGHIPIKHPSRTVRFKRLVANKIVDLFMIKQ